MPTFPKPSSNRVKYEHVAKAIQSELNLPNPYSVAILSQLFYGDLEEKTFKSENLDDLYLFFSGKEREEFITKGKPDIFEYTLFQGTEFIYPDVEKAELVVERETKQTLRVKVSKVAEIKNMVLR